MQGQNDISRGSNLQTITFNTSCNVEFRLDGITNCFLSPAELGGQPIWSCQSPLFGPGFVLNAVRIEKGPPDRRQSWFRLFLSLDDKLPPLSCVVSVSLKWPNNAPLGKTVTRTLQLGDGGRGICSLTVPPSERYRLASDPSMLCNVVVRYYAADLVGALLPDSSLDLLYASLFFNLPEMSQAVTNDRISVYAHDRRGPGGRLSGRRQMYIAASALAQAASCTFDTVLRKGVGAQLWTKGSLSVVVHDLNWTGPDSDVADVEESSLEPETPSIGMKQFPGLELVVVGASARTMEAVLYWAISGCITFKPLTSSGEDKSKAFEILHSKRGSANRRPRPVSCKSVYRVAHMLGFLPLKACALIHLRGEITVDNVLDELFSVFTAQFDEVRELETASLVKYWNILKSSEKLVAKMAEVASGKLPHAGKVVADLLTKVSSWDNIAYTHLDEDSDDDRMPTLPVPSAKRQRR